MQLDVALHVDLGREGNGSCNWLRRGKVSSIGLKG